MYARSPSRLYTVTGLLTIIPVSRPHLMELIALLGYRPPPGRRKYLFSERQVSRIKRLVMCEREETGHPPGIYFISARPIAWPIDPRLPRLQEEARRRVAEDVADTPHVSLQAYDDRKSAAR